MRSPPVDATSGSAASVDGQGGGIQALEIHPSGQALDAGQISAHPRVQDAVLRLGDRPSRIECGVEVLLKKNLVASSPRLGPRDLNQGTKTCVTSFLRSSHRSSTLVSLREAEADMHKLRRCWRVTATGITLEVRRKLTSPCSSSFQCPPLSSCILVLKHRMRMGDLYCAQEITQVFVVGKV